ncbi:MAG: chemotaxis protein CheW [Synechococcaceae cyanobacterium SM2_3_2]|nr:chemotaxis protein CheW [Synechococcaceae cyanobacterium SM2_3_2]
MVPLDSLVEVLPLTSVVPMPGMPNPVIGICNWRGEVVWLVDVSLLLGKSPLYQNPQPSYTAVILDFENQPLGLVAHQVGHIQTIEAQKIDQTSTKTNPLLLGSWEGKDILDPAILLPFLGQLSSTPSL